MRLMEPWIQTLKLRFSHQLESHNQDHSSFSLLIFLFSACSSSILPVTGRWRTASGPHIVSKPLWNPHSTASSTGLSKMNGRKGTAARPSCLHQLLAFRLPKSEWTRRKHTPIGPYDLIVVFFAFLSAFPLYRTRL